MRKRSGFLKYNALLSSVIMLAVPAFAQETGSEPAPEETQSQPADSTARLGTVLVTAERRTVDLQQVPISVTAIGEEALARAGLNNATDIVAKVPSLSFASLGGSFVAYNIRGVSQNDFTDHLEPPIAMYVDDSYLATPSQTSLPVFDIQRVEVLRGPQGTLFGRNATGGLIKFVSNQPTDTPEGYFDVMLTDEVSGKFEGAVSGPIAKNVQGRVAVSFLSREGYMENNASEGGKLGGENYIAGRSILAFQPTDRTDVNINLRYYKNFDMGGSPIVFSPSVFNEQGLGRFVTPDENPYGTCNGCPAPFYGGYVQADTYEGAYSTPGNFEREALGGTVKVEHEFDSFTLVAITDYQTLDKDWIEDTDGAPADIVTDTHDQELDQFTQEIRADFDTDRLNLTVGTYFYYQDSQTVNQYGLFGGLQDPRGEADVESRSIAFFGQGDYDLTPDLTLTLGARYTYDEREIDFTLADVIPLPAFEFNPTTYPELADKSDDLYAYRAALQWRAADNLMLFGSFTRGTKSGNFALPFFLPAAPELIAFEPEVLYSYEIGEKWTSSNGNLRINATAFYYDYENYQAYIFAAAPGFNPVGTIRNLPATAKGLELEVSYRPTDALTLNANLVGMDSEVKGVVLPVGDVVNRSLPQAPDFSGNAMARYEFPVFGDKVAAFQADVQWASDKSFTAIAAPTELEDGYMAGDLRLSLSAEDGSWEAALFAKNISNNERRVWAYDLATFGTTAQIPVRPRSFGISFRRKFN